MAPKLSTRQFHLAEGGGSGLPQIATNEPNAALADLVNRVWADEERTLVRLLAGRKRRSAVGSGLALKSQHVACLMPGACHKSVEG